MLRGNGRAAVFYIGIEFGLKGDVVLTQKADSGGDGVVGFCHDVGGMGCKKAILAVFRLPFALCWLALAGGCAWAA